MNKVITNKISECSTGEIFNELADSANKIIITVAFFSDSTVINRLIKSGKKIILVVSLRPPTNYYSLKDILHKDNVEVLFLGDDFHSKIYGFYNKRGDIKSAILGSSNFTNGGFSNNYETNLVTHDVATLTQIDSNLTDIVSLATKLQPDALNQYKKRYDLFKKYKEKDAKVPPVISTPSKQKNLKIPSEYLKFWQVADQVKYIVEDIAKREYPLIPVYLVIDHFWHWIVAICDQSRLKKSNPNSSKNAKIIRCFFIEYCEWDKSESNSFTEGMGQKSKTIQKLLAPNEISKLNKKNALLVYRSLHSTRMRIQRFDSDKYFIENNKIQNIRKSFTLLLDDKLQIEFRIHELTKAKGPYRLKGFGESCVQELIGWANPEVMPIRNLKADEAIALLGYININLERK